MKARLSICWFRRDLRLDDHAAFFHALKSPYPVLPVFIFDPDILDGLTDKYDPRVSFIYNTLRALDLRLQDHGSGFYVVYSSIEEAFLKILDMFDVQAVFTNNDYEPYAIKRDANIRALLGSRGILFQSYKDQVIFEKLEILKSDGSPYTIFTPYSRQWKQKFTTAELTGYPSEKFLSNLFKTKQFQFPELEETGFSSLDPVMPKPDFSERTIRNYHKTRDFPSPGGTSHVSHYLRFGIISIRRVVSLACKWNETWLNELIWREFFMMILYCFPGVVSESFKKKYDKIPWRNDEKEFELWCKGETGYPLVDAGMRQLNETGWMHNRVRMIVAGFLTKHLLIDWRWGEAYFRQKLLDYELSSNNGNWQWAAGSGCDSAPYFRIFNPITQAKKFDPRQAYVRTWIKDFDSYDIPPVVENDFARKRAISVYRQALSEV